MSHPSINFTENAAGKVWELIQEENNFNLKLRVYVTGGGCKGFKYGFTFDEAVNDDDEKIVKAIDGNDVHLLVDALSFQYLSGAEIDYENGIDGEHFIVRNPNSNTTCGCGSSFSV